MKLPSYFNLLEMSKEKIDQTLAPIRAAKAKSQANLEMVKLDEQIAVMEANIMESCTKHEINFSALIDNLDRVALLERKKKQYQTILKDLFPGE